VGVASRETFGVANNPGIFTDVLHYRKWIKCTTGLGLSPSQA
jgi:secreted trypsin-like serine protease